MQLSDFDFDLPRELIAQRPLEPREAARLLHVSAAGLADKTIADLPELLRAGDLLVFNDTKVIPARLRGRRKDAKAEVLLHKPEGEDARGRLLWLCFARPAKRLRPGETLVFAEGFEAEILEKHEGGELLLAFAMSPEALRDALERHGEAPLPPYIERQGGADEQDRHDYQTIFARREGAVAAPTAGLHFTEPLMARLAAKGVETAEVTLHVGAGTFLPVKSEAVSEHRMHSEWGEIGEKTAARIAAAKAQGRRVVSVGTTSLRILETAAQASGAIAPFRGDSDLFILPGFDFKVVDLLVTNFHLPRSTLFMLVSAFSGRRRMLAAYEQAKQRGYRFYSYGDACLLERVTEDLPE
jgi:S-adenosylmethionine:tRNA ribosyltransferase-isomerase